MGRDLHYCEVECEEEYNRFRCEHERTGEIRFDDCEQGFAFGFGGCFEAVVACQGAEMTGFVFEDLGGHGFTLEYDNYDYD